MKDDAVWRAFASTGDPLCYLLYKTLEAGEKDRKRKKPPEQNPRPAD